MTFKIGDKVKLNPNKVTQGQLIRELCKGSFDVEYKIDSLGGILHGKKAVRFEGNNWHCEEWLDKVDIIYLGGE